MIIKNIKVMVSNIFLNRLEEKGVVTLTDVMEELSRYGVNDVIELKSVSFSKYHNILKVEYLSKLEG